MIRFDDFKILKPLRIRDFALLWIGMTVSLLGDGIYLVALAWQVYDLSNVPTALSTVFVAWTAPMVVFLLVGGVMTDRFDRRKVLIFSDVVRGVAIAGVGLLSVSGHIELWHLYVLVAIYGAGDAFFGPAFGAIVPDIVPRDMLLEANSLGQFVRPFAMRLAGPALGGFLIAVAGDDAGPALLVNALTFAVSALCLGLMTAQPGLREEDDAAKRSALRELLEGLRFVRSRAWLWATLLSATASLLFFYGPYEVLVPYIVRNKLDGSADDLGFVFAVGGVGAILAALVMAQRGLPRRHIRLLYGSWAVAVGSVTGYGFVTEIWQAMAVSLVEGAAVTVGMVVWGTMLHRLVPRELLGRVESLDWFISIGLVPVSFAVTGPISGALGVDTTLIGAGILGTIATLAFLAVPGIFDTEHDGSMSPPSPASSSQEGESPIVDRERVAG